MKFRRGNWVQVHPNVRGKVVSSGMKLNPNNSYKVAETRTGVCKSGSRQLVRLFGLRSWFRSDWFIRA